MTCKTSFSPTIKPILQKQNTPKLADKSHPLQNLICANCFDHIYFPTKYSPKRIVQLIRQSLQNGAVGRGKNIIITAQQVQN